MTSSAGQATAADHLPLVKPYIVTALRTWGEWVAAVGCAMQIMIFYHCQFHCAELVMPSRTPTHATHTAALVTIATKLVIVMAALKSAKACGLTMTTEHSRTQPNTMARLQD